MRFHSVHKHWGTWMRDGTRACPSERVSRSRLQHSAVLEWNLALHWSINFDTVLAAYYFCDDLFINYHSYALRKVEEARLFTRRAVHDYGYAAATRTWIANDIFAAYLLLRSLLYLLFVLHKCEEKSNLPKTVSLHLKHNSISEIFKWIHCTL